MRGEIETDSLEDESFDSDELRSVSFLCLHFRVRFIRSLCCLGRGEREGRGSLRIDPLRFDLFLLP